ncbi:unnamed protein product [Heligmosomoides polygyrus]|uniref:BACK domain-containing protein n=1 Tax=Heligmosomoides polygyrus TaxID=6339 RepID=A0A3P7YVP0_HELPZ|nr:unnamed protein product [Heligmosomoides polygyrus]
MSVDIAFLIAETSATLSIESLTECCNQFCDRHAIDVLKSKEFPILSLSKVMEMLSRDTFYAPEIDIFRALTGWIRTQPVMEPNQLLELFKKLISENCLRLHLVSPKELLTTVRRSTIFTPISYELDKCILDAIEVKDNGTGPSRRQSPGV